MIRVSKAIVRNSKFQLSRSLSSANDITIDLHKDDFATHCECCLYLYVHRIYDFFFTVVDPPSLAVNTSKDELLGFLKQMYTMRRMEITNDTEYKVGFCFSNL